MFTCNYCTWVGPGNDFEIDHMIPLSRGGADTDQNKQIICSGCNREKADRTHEEYLAFRIVMGVLANQGPIKK